jgi:hypothetical protein
MDRQPRLAGLPMLSSIELDRGEMRTIAALRGLEWF